MDGGVLLPASLNDGRAVIDGCSDFCFSTGNHKAKSRVTSAFVTCCDVLLRCIALMIHRVAVKE